MSNMSKTPITSLLYSPKTMGNTQRVAFTSARTSNVNSPVKVHHLSVTEPNADGTILSDQDEEETTENVTRQGDNNNEDLKEEMEVHHATFDGD